MLSSRASRVFILVGLVAVGFGAAWAALGLLERTRLVPIPARAASGVPATVTYVAARDAQICDAVLSADGSVAYLAITTGKVNVWRATSTFWPEIALAVLIVLAAIIALWLRRRRPTTTDPHCRRCNYALMSCATDRCSECGLELNLRNRVRAHRRRWVIALPIALLALPPVAGYVFARKHLPRDGGWRNAFVWPSSALYDWGYHRGGRIKSICDGSKIYVHELVEVDLATGRVQRTLYAQPSRRGTAHRLAASGDRGLLAAVRGSEALLVDPIGGAATPLGLAPGQRGRPGDFSEVVCSSDGRTVWTVAAISEIARYDTATATRTASVQPRPDRTSASAVVRSITCLDEPERLIAIVYDFGARRRAYEMRFDERLEPAGGGREVSRQVISRIVPAGGAWVGTELQGGLLVATADTERPAWQVRLPGQLSLGLAASDDGRLVAVGRRDAATGVARADVYRTGVWQPEVSLGLASASCDALAFSSDGRRLAVTGQRSTATGTSSTISIYDLPALPDP